MENGETTEQLAADAENHTALCSGGTDSVAATHAAMTFGPAERVVFLHTRTDPPDAYSAIDATVEWLREWCGEHGWPFEVRRAPVGFEGIVAEHGYPGPSRHFLLYRRLKERAIQALAADTSGDLYCWTGIRRWESENRMQVAEPEGEHGDGRWFWRAPLVNWQDQRVEAYLSRFGLEPAPVVREIGRSADCWCGCFGDRGELLDLAAAGYGTHADWLDSLPAPDDCPREEQRWAGYNWDKADWADEDDLQQTLCSACAVPDGGGA